MMRTLLLLLVVLFPSGLQAQVEQAKAVKFDDFGDIEWSDKAARLDNFAIKLQEASSMKGFIVVYRSRRDLPGLSSRLARQMRNYLVQARGLSEDRIIDIDGGEASYLSQELWLVPLNAAPTPRKDIYQTRFEDIDSAREFDDYSLGGMDAEIEGDSLEAFSDAVRRSPRARAYVIVYPLYYVQVWESTDTETNKTKRERQVYQDTIRETNKLMGEINKILVSEYKLSPSRVTVVNGGYRRWRAVELWILPGGEHPPIATPNSFPKSRRR
jgi:hypothetical protein